MPFPYWCFFVVKYLPLTIIIMCYMIQPNEHRTSVSDLVTGWCEEGYWVALGYFSNTNPLSVPSAGQSPLRRVIFILKNDDIERMFVRIMRDDAAICLGNLCIIEKRYKLDWKTDVERNWTEKTRMKWWIRKCPNAHHNDDDEDVKGHAWQKYAMIIAYANNDVERNSGN